MALSAGYVLRESAGNLKRNLFMTLAAVLCMAVSLTALGAVLVMRQAIHTLSLQSEGGVELAIFLNPQASDTQISAIQTQLKATPGVKNFHYVDKQAAYKEFQQIFAGDTDISHTLTPNDMPPSYRVVPTRAQDVAQLGNLFTGQPGVLRVSYPAEEVRTLVAQAKEWRLWGSVLAAVVLVAAIALIVNTIQLAIFARRREVAVMKLVGATNWFIRVPFMLEGLIHGIAGAIVGFVVVYFARNGIAAFLPSETFLGTHLLIPVSSALRDGVVILVVGAIVGVFGSMFAVRRYLAV